MHFRGVVDIGSCARRTRVDVLLENRRRLEHHDRVTNKGARAVVRDPPGSVRAALAQAGLAPDRVIYVEVGDDKAVLACFEEALRHRKLGAVVAEVARLSMADSRRLQLAAEGSGVIGLALRRWRRQAQAAEFEQPTAATTRWRVSALPSTPLPVPGVGRARRRLELIRCRRGESADFEVEACDPQGRLALPAGPGHGLLIHICADRRRDAFPPR
jgi:hypothetical protein